MKQAFRQPGFGLLFTGLATSMIGDSLMLIVLAIWVKELTGSSGAAGLVFFFMVLPTLASPLAGMLVDRARRRTVLIWGNLASAAILTPCCSCTADMTSGSSIWSPSCTASRGSCSQAH